jgi:hypothetical protein
MKTTAKPRSLLWASKVVLASLVLASGLIAIAPGVASASACVGWTGVQPPNPSSSDNEFAGVAVLSSCNAWAVGYYSDGTANQTLIEHWNGGAWRQVPSPNPGGSANNNVLRGVGAVSASDVWAVGDYFDGTALRTLVERWNGRSWKQVPSQDPSGSANFNFLDGVAATSSRNAWAVGEYRNGNAERTLIERWNGAAWKQVRSPNPGGSANYNTLSSVVATSSGNAWAVGDYRNAAGLQTLIAHWNGTAWKHVPSPNRTSFNELFDVAATSSRNAWAVGEYRNGSADQTLIEHWNGSHWKYVKSQDLGGSGTNNILSSVTATSSRNAWAVGYYSGLHPLVFHWNGTAWKRVESPEPGGFANYNILNGVAAASSTTMWAVGYYSTPTAFQTLALHCC